MLLNLSGCKIKALRAKTNTYIKTPVRGEDPVFIVTGRREDVEMAKREIVSAAEHFSMIRASRCKAGGGGGGSLPGPPHLPGQTTIQVPKSLWLGNVVFLVVLYKITKKMLNICSLKRLEINTNLAEESFLLVDPGQSSLQSRWFSCWTKRSNN